MWVKFIPLLFFVNLTYVLTQNKEETAERPPNNCTNIYQDECEEDAHHLHCHDPCDDSIHLCMGESVDLPGKCMIKTCLNPNGDVILTRGCPIVKPKPGCYVVQGNIALPFPKCCPRVICKFVPYEVCPV